MHERGSRVGVVNQSRRGWKTQEWTGQGAGHRSRDVKKVGGAGGGAQEKGWEGGRGPGGGAGAVMRRIDKVERGGARVINVQGRAGNRGGRD